ncbi:hypothetical protein [Oceanisphaera psychrotolerans]|uniref:Uncharacterized protein n=1 Tax=Oceanisphaera psychrotolerans TaxID=1414654 RepID=A0A1J4QDE6_9GAMM|nr:hypothetical protein [Oceanisphaera psychrotolerans]OIN09078.1 hypothetical protein BFR47_02035 [Oceanisphaera psychrotolerans]
MAQVAEWLGLAIAAAGLLIGILSPVLTSLFGRLSRQQVDMANHRAHVAENYATKTELSEGFNRLEQRIDGGFTRLDEKLERLQK